MRDLLHKNSNQRKVGGPAFGNLPVRALAHGIGGRFVQGKFGLGSFGDLDGDNGDDNFAVHASDLKGYASATLAATNSHFASLEVARDIIDPDAGRWGLQCRVKLDVINNGVKLFVGLADNSGDTGIFDDAAYGAGTSTDLDVEVGLDASMDHIGFFIDSVNTAEGGPSTAADAVVKCVHGKTASQTLVNLGSGSVVADTILDLAISYSAGRARMFIDGVEKADVLSSDGQYPAGNLRPILIAKQIPPLSTGVTAKVITVELFAAGQED